MNLYFSIDLESWAYPDLPQFLGLDSLSRKKIDNGFILQNIDKILLLLSKYNQKITFFILGEMFEWYPDAIRNIKNAGHEIAYHSHRHTRITNIDALRQEIHASKAFIDEFKPIGFRAPQIFMPQEAIRALKESGFRYSSSVYGNSSDIFKSGYADFLEFPVSTYLYRRRSQRILGYPRPLSFRMLFNELPFGTGYFLATLPIKVTVGCIENYLKANQPIFMFVHNWQIFRPQNAIFPNLKYKLTHPAYLPYTVSLLKKISFILKNYKIDRMDELVWTQKSTGTKK